MGRHAPLRDSMGYHGNSWASTGSPSKIAEFCGIPAVKTGQKETVTLRTKVKHTCPPMKNRGLSAAMKTRCVSEMKEGQMACKPGSVSRPKAVDGHSSGTPVAGRLLQPTRAAVRKRTCPRKGGRATPIRFCSRWGLPCHDRYRPRGALLPHPFTLTCRLPRRRFAFCGTFPGVAPAGRYPAPCFRGARTFLCLATAAIRPSDPEKDLGTGTWTRQAN